MRRVRLLLLAVVLLVGLFALAGPGSAAAALDDPDQPTFAVPGVFSLSLGEGLSSTDGSLKLDGTTIEVPAIGATATVNGLVFNFRDGLQGWENIIFTRGEPLGSEAFMVSDLQVEVGGPAAAYSSGVSARFDLQPSEAVQAGATVGLNYDGTQGAVGLSVADGSALVDTESVVVGVDGITAGEGALAVDTIVVGSPAVGVGAALEGFQVENGQAMWSSLTLAGEEVVLGDVARISDMAVIIPGPAAETAMPAGATAVLEFNIGNVASAGGQLVSVYDTSTGQMSFGLRNGNIIMGVPDWNVAVLGLNAGEGTATADNVILTASPLGLEAQVAGVAVGGDQGFVFDQARVTYQPVDATGEVAGTGFEMVIDRTDAGYVVTTTTTLPIASAGN